MGLFAAGMVVPVIPAMAVIVAAATAPIVGRVSNQRAPEATDSRSNERPFTGVPILTTNQGAGAGTNTGSDPCSLLGRSATG